MITKYLLYNAIRRTPNKAIIIFNLWIFVGIVYNKGKIIASYYEFKLKEINAKRKYMFELACKM